jgi:hypothetical protein
MFMFASTVDPAPPVTQWARHQFRLHRGPSGQCLIATGLPDKRNEATVHTCSVVPKPPRACRQLS